MTVTSSYSNKLLNCIIVGFSLFLAAKDELRLQNAPEQEEQSRRRASSLSQAGLWGEMSSD